MEYLNDLCEILWWALASGGALLGNFGGGGSGSAPQPPKPDFKQSEKLTRADYSLKREFIPKLSAAAGRAARTEYGRNLDFAIKQLGDSSLGRQLTRAMPEVAAQRNALNRQLQAAGQSTDQYRRAQKAMQRGLQPQQVRQRSAATSVAAAAQANTVQGRAAQMGKVADVRAQQMDASTMGNFGAARSRNISAGQVGAGALGETLMGRAKQMAKSTGRLSAEADRDAVQSARSGMAARGMAMGSGAMAAELLNRDQYSRQRQFEDLGFAQGVQGQDITRQFQNVGNRLTADQSNQSAAMQAELANLQARYNAAVQDGNWEQAAAIQNQSADMQASLANQQTAFNTGQFNAGNQQQMSMANMAAINQGNQFNAANRQQTSLSNMAARNSMAQFNAGLGSSIDQFNAGQRTDAGRYNMGLLGTASQMADAERGRRLGLRQDAYNFALSSNPNMVAMGLGSGYANMTTPSMSLMGGQNMQMMYSGGQFSSGQGGGGANPLMGAAGGALSGAAMGSVLGPWGAAGGAVAGGLTGYFGSQ
jgi:hypothetical protein